MEPRRRMGSYNSGSQAVAAAAAASAQDAAAAAALIDPALAAIDPASSPGKSVAAHGKAGSWSSVSRCGHRLLLLQQPAQDVAAAAARVAPAAAARVAPAATARVACKK